MKRSLPEPFWRKIYYVNPRLQGGVALLFAAIVAAGGAFFGFSLLGELRAALGNAALQGHYALGSPYEVVRQTVVSHLVALFLGVSLVGTAAFLLVVRTTERGLERVIAVLRVSVDGDLSTPARAPGLPEIARFGEQMDLIRTATLSQVEELRGDVAQLAQDGASADDFRLRWDMLKQKIRRIAP
jgi:hypothetical protein